MKLTQVVFTMNNKGQTLVVFVLLMPIILLIFIGIIDICNLQYEKRKIEKTLDTAIEYYKSGKDIDKYLSKTISDYEINTNNGIITIKAKKNINGLIQNHKIELIREENSYGTQ